MGHLDADVQKFLSFIKIEVKACFEVVMAHPLCRGTLGPTDLKKTFEPLDLLSLNTNAKQAHCTPERLRSPNQGTLVLLQGYPPWFSALCSFSPMDMTKEGHYTVAPPIVAVSMNLLEGCRSFEEVSQKCLLVLDRVKEDGDPSIDYELIKAVLMGGLMIWKDARTDPLLPVLAALIICFLHPKSPNGIDQAVVRAQLNSGDGQEDFLEAALGWINDEEGRVEASKEAVKQAARAARTATQRAARAAERLARL